MGVAIHREREHGRRNNSKNNPFLGNEFDNFWVTNLEPFRNNEIGSRTKRRLHELEMQI